MRLRARPRDNALPGGIAQLRGLIARPPARTASWSRRRVMGFYMRSIRWLPFSILAMASATLLPADGIADARCSGHRLLPTPRPEASCRDVVPRIFVSPDKTIRALVFPVD